MSKRIGTITTTPDSLTVTGDSGPTTIGIVAPHDSIYPSSKLTVTISTLPNDGTVLLSNGATSVYVHERLTVQQLTTLFFQPTPGAFNTSSTFTYQVTDPSGATATGTATLSIAPQNTPPTTTPAALTVSGNSGPTQIGIVAPTDPGYTGSQLSVTLTGIPSDGTVLLPGTLTPVTLGQSLTVAQLVGLEFQPTPGAFALTSHLTYTVTDPASLSAAGVAALAIGAAPGSNVLTVGPGQQYATLSAAVGASHDGDTIQVQAGTYVNDFAEINTNVTIEGVGGMAHFVCTTDIPNGKAILVTNSNVTINNLEFSGATVADGNGAGIRYQAGNLTLNDDYFHDNQDGILAAANPIGNITINNSEFAHNGTGDGFTHNIYVSDINSLTINSSYIHDAVVGHEVKSRAENTYIYNSRIYDGPSGTASFSIDLPNGGNAVIQNNVIEQGPYSQNPAIIAFGEEGGVHANSALQVSGNTILNDLTSSGAVGVWNATAGASAQIANCKFFGLTPSQIALGSSTQTNDIFLTSEPSVNTSPPWFAIS